MLVHVHPDPNELGRVYEPTLGIVASAPRFAAALADLEPPTGRGVPASSSAPIRPIARRCRGGSFRVRSS